jgi:hypothetical protein
MIGHFVKPRSAAGKMCPHACCRNKRVHPGNYPVVLPSRLLRRASDEDLAEHYERSSDQAARDQVLYEMERRDRAEAQRQERRRAYGPEARARRYASEELINHWQEHPRPTGAMFAGRDTRVREQYSAPRRKQYGTGRRIEVTRTRRKAS